jgi:RimJ/RimL family protein N-acetyltransferase
MLKGKLVNLRAVEKKDLEEIMKWVNDLEVIKYLSSFIFPVSRIEEEKYLEKMMSKNDKQKNLVIETKEGKEEGRLRKGQFYGGKYYDVILMGILKDEFEKMDK